MNEYTFTVPVPSIPEVDQQVAELMITGSLTIIGVVLFAFMGALWPRVTAFLVAAAFAVVLVGALTIGIANAQPVPKPKPKPEARQETVTPAPSPQVEFFAATCVGRAGFVETLSEKFGEVQQGFGTTGATGVFELYAAPDGSWTAVISTPAGRSCILSVGENWTSVLEIPGDDA